MSKYKQAKPLYRFKLIIVIALAIVSYSSFSQINDNYSTINNTDTSIDKQAQDYNSSRAMKVSNRNRTNQTLSPNVTNENDSLPIPAQDYNSSRSNKPRPIALINDTIGNDSVLNRNKAQDYNSSRSNKPSPILNRDIKFEKDTIPKATQAQDYNSSRSNKPRPLIVKDDTIKNNIKRKKLKLK